MQLRSNFLTWSVMYFVYTAGQRVKHSLNCHHRQCGSYARISRNSFQRLFLGASAQYITTHVATCCTVYNMYSVRFPMVDPYLTQPSQSLHYSGNFTSCRTYQSITSYTDYSHLELNRMFMKQNQCRVSWLQSDAHCTCSVGDDLLTQAHTLCHTVHLRMLFWHYSAPFATPKGQNTCFSISNCCSTKLLRKDH